MAWWLEFDGDASDGDVYDGDSPARQPALLNRRVTRICFDNWRSLILQSLREYILDLWIDVHIYHRRREAVALFDELAASGDPWQRAALVASASRDAAPEI